MTMISVRFLCFLWIFRYIQAQEKPSFRVVAPDFICAKDEDTVVEKADETVIMLQTRGASELVVDWKVRWQPLPSPTQRFTLMVWKAVRELEALLNRTQKQKNVYVIDNSKLLRGIVYTFTVNARTADGIPAEPRSFKLDNTQGEKELTEVDGRGGKFSVNLLGSELVYADSELVLEAQVTSCVPTEDYHFSWSVRDVTSNDEVDTSQVAGARLVVPANSLKSGSTYAVNCKVIRSSTNDTIAQTVLQLEVSSRGSNVYLNADFLVIGKGEPFYIDSLVIDGDYYNATRNFQWSCVFNAMPCAFFETENLERISFPSGLLELGNYTFSVIVEKEISSNDMTISVIDADLLPVLELSPTNRVLNEGSQVTLSAAASNVAPSCTFTWYFKGQNDDSVVMNESCVECQHGTPISVSKTVNSLEENFLEELADFTNTTQKVQLQMTMSAASGRVRLVADCGCSLTFSCESQGVVYADVDVVVNEYPVPGGVLISPSSGVALETVFRISTEPVTHPEVPLRYTFYCAPGTSRNQSLVLGSYVEFTSVETVLPFVDDTGTEVWVEVCDSLGACSTGVSSRVFVARDTGRTADALLATLEGKARRCEMMMLQRVAVSAVVSYMNSGLSDTLAVFSSHLHELLDSAYMETCRNIYTEEYAMLLQSLADVGFV